jgi:lipoyl(octanoyl) transferase
MSSVAIRIRRLGNVPYEPTWRAMQRFTETRGEDTPDEIWLLQHPPVFTLGLAGKPEHILDAGEIPVVQVDRGGQVTYHGPGQIVMYPLLDLKRHGLGVRRLVTLLEHSAIALAADFGIEAVARADAPGVYVEGRKLAAVGLRVRRGCSYHGLSFNVAMDLSPFRRINPCGYAGLETTQLQDLGVEADPLALQDVLANHLLRQLAAAPVLTSEPE